MAQMKLTVAGFTAGALSVCLVLAGCGTDPSAKFTEPVISDLAASTLSLSSDDSGSRDGDHHSYNLEAVVYRLRTVAAPLFQHYGLKFGEDWSESRAFRTMTGEVSFVVNNGVVTVTNKATGGVIFKGPLTNVASGVFSPENIPGGTPPPSACTYVYSAWAACQSSSTQIRTVVSSTPAGCTGTPILSQACVYTPPPPVPCSYTTGVWGACQLNGTQTRTVTAFPAGCTGTQPAASQPCTYVPPAVTCTGFTYSAFTPAVCPSSGQQTRTVATSSPAGCTGGSPVLGQACTYVPPVVTCTAFNYSAWGTCSASGTQTRTVTSSVPAGCTGGTQVLSQTCTPPPVACTYTSGAWGTCSAAGTQTRTVTASPSGCTGTPPASSQSCTPPVVTCTSFTYSAVTPAVCPASGQQTRTVVSSAPAGCTGGTPIVTVACTYVPDGAALYTAKCAGCHGALATSAKAGRTAAQITSANMTQGLTPVEVQAVAAALATVVPPPAPSGSALYTSTCAGCHGPLGTSAKAGRTAAQITGAGMTMGLTAVQVQAVANALSGSALYANTCAGCHGPLATSAKKGRTAAQITSAGMTMGLTAAQVQDVATALAP
jgi:mono/diheme cytochrome c family protein